MNLNRAEEEPPVKGTFRETDPVTSREAAPGVSRVYQSCRTYAAIALTSPDGLTDQEAYAIGRRAGVKYTAARLRTARYELQAHGAVVPVDGVYRRGPSGRRAQVYRLDPEKYEALDGVLPAPVKPAPAPVPAPSSPEQAVTRQQEKIGQAARELVILIGLDRAQAHLRATAAQLRDPRK